MPQSMQLRTSVGALSRGEYVGAVVFAVSLTDDGESLASAVAVDPTGGEKSPVSARRCRGQRGGRG